MNVRDFFHTQTEIVVFDTEFTTWEGAKERNWSGDFEHRELVQIAAKKINLRTESVIDSFELFIKPTINPILSEFFIQLTGISQTQIDENGIDFATGYKKFVSWSDDLPKFAYNRREYHPADLSVLQENMELYNLPYEIPQNEYGNLAAVYQSVGIDTYQYSSGELFRAFGLELDGHVHNAMHDVDSLVACLFATKRILVG